MAKTRVLLAIVLFVVPPSTTLMKEFIPAMLIFKSALPFKVMDQLTKTHDYRVAASRFTV
jgi:hypothetical protein